MVLWHLPRGPYRGPSRGATGATASSARCLLPPDGLPGGEAAGCLAWILGVLAWVLGSPSMES